MPQQDPPRCSHLASQRIDEDGPGSILIDFEVLLGFVEDGVQSSGKHHLLPMARLFELDRLMTKPLQPRLKRPQQRSFPHLNGLYLLLRATQLGVAEGHGKTSGQLTLDSAMYRQWRQLNATERYFNLLEAWLRRGSWGAVGLRGGGGMSQIAMHARELWQSIPAAGRSFSEKERRRGEFLYCTERACTLALLELFGMMTVGRDEPGEGQSWRVTEVRHTPFGEELLPIVFDEIEREFFAREKRAEFGAWQPVLRSCFPQWVNNLKIVEPEFRHGVYYFKVSLGEPWRRIAIPAKSDLDDLAECIIRAFNFDGDHLYGFRLVARDGHQLRIEHHHINDAERHTDEVTIGKLPLNERQSMQFHYDFGDDWRFDVQLEKIEPEGAKISKATIVESQGKAPKEYEFEDE